MANSENKQSFVGAFFTVLLGTLPFMALLIIGVAAACSNGTWGYFFREALPIIAKYGIPFWVFTSGYLALARLGNTSGGSGGGGGGDSDDCDSHRRTVNPGSGLPTIGGPGTQDIAGNNWGDY